MQSEIENHFLSKVVVGWWKEPKETRWTLLRGAAAATDGDLSEEFSLLHAVATYYPEPVHETA